MHTVEFMAIETNRQQRLGGFGAKVAVVGADQPAQDRCFAGGRDAGVGRHKLNSRFKLQCRLSVFLAEIRI
jgi:hypothetical protein